MEASELRTERAFVVRSAFSTSTPKKLRAQIISLLLHPPQGEFAFFGTVMAAAVGLLGLLEEALTNMTETTTPNYLHTPHIH